MDGQLMTGLEIIEANGRSDLARSHKKGTHPVGAYIASLAEGSRAGQFSALASALAAANGNRLGDLPRPEAESYRAAVWSTDWSQLRYEHVAAIRGQGQFQQGTGEAAARLNQREDGARGQIDPLQGALESPGLDNVIPGIEVSKIRGITLERAKVGYILRLDLAHQGLTLSIFGDLFR